MREIHGSPLQQGVGSVTILDSSATAGPLMQMATSDPLELSEIISLETVKVPLSAADKHTAIGELVDLLDEAGLISDAEALKAVVWERGCLKRIRRVGRTYACELV